MKACALVVGINEYPKAAGVGDLHGAVADAADFADWALDPNGGNVEDRLYYWTYPATADPSPRLAQYLQNPKAWADGIMPDPTRGPKMDEVADTALEMGKTLPKDNVERIYVFFAGHGVQTVSIEAQTERQTCFIVNDFSPGGRTKGLIPCDDLRRGLLQTNFFAEVLMFLDCCRTPLNFNQSPPSLAWPKAPVENLPYGVGLAAKSGAKAYEAPEDAPARGAFSQVLIEGLRRRRDDANVLTLNDLETYVSTGIGNILGQGKQFPQFLIEPRNPPFRLLSSAATQPFIPIVISFKLITPGETVYLVDSKGNRIGDPLVAGKEPIRIKAVAGTFYSIETSDRARNVSFKHDGPGATHVEF